MKSIAILVLAALFTGTVAYADDPEFPEVAGLVGLETETGAGWLAILVPVPAEFAVSGLVWYNNDGLVDFPEVLVATGHETGPGIITDAMVVAETLAGDSSDWSEVVFSEPVAASLGRMYMIFAFPEGDGYIADGVGGGPAVGFLDSDDGCTGWISGDGEQWASLHTTYRFAAIPQFVPYEEGMAVKSLDESSSQSLPGVAAPYFEMSPNPFNPQIELRFGLPREMNVVIDIFDLRGARVVRLVDDVFSAGRHQVAWRGRDGSGRTVASGAYIARLNAGSIVMTKRMTLLK